MSKKKNPATPSPSSPNPDARPLTPEERAKRNRRFIDGVWTLRPPDGQVLKLDPPPRVSQKAIDDYLASKKRAKKT